MKIEVIKNKVTGIPDEKRDAKKEEVESIIGKRRRKTKLIKDEDEIKAESGCEEGQVFDFTNQIKASPAAAILTPKVSSNVQKLESAVGSV